MNLVPRKNKVLHKKAKAVLDFKDPKLKKLVVKMKEIVGEEQGIGLAAPQIGKSLAIFVIDEDLIEETEKKINPVRKSKISNRVKKFLKRRAPEVFINPEIKELLEEKILMDEGCLSIPRVFGTVSRSRKLVVKACNENGKEFKLKAEGLLARVIQHEVDHLNGVLFVERAMKGTLYKIKQGPKY